MHEFSICGSLVDAVLSEMDAVTPPARRLLKARVVIGRLRQIAPDYLTFAYETLTRDTSAEGSVLDITHAPAAGKCRDCGWNGEMGKTSFHCGECGSINVDVEGGTELYLESLEVEQDD